MVLQKGWRCLDCTVCEGCGERNDESRLILCDDCDISYHIYCMDPPLDYVPQGTWKCKWCAQCQTCGSNNAGQNSNWQKNYTQCGPCASHAACACCQEAYNEGDLIIQCIQCERWLHSVCDSIKNEEDAEKCAEEGYVCILCRPEHQLPPHLVSKAPKPLPPIPAAAAAAANNPANLTASSKYSKSPPPVQISATTPEIYKPSTQHYLVEGVYLSEAGMSHIKALTFEQQQTRKKRRKLHQAIGGDKDANIMATIDSVASGGTQQQQQQQHLMHMSGVKDEPPEVHLKEGMIWNSRDQPPPEGFSIYTTESGQTILRRKRQRNLQKVGIGGFSVRLRGTRKDINSSRDEDGDEKPPLEMAGLGEDNKPRRKPQRRKLKTKLSECFPSYMQEAFFGKDLMDTTKDKDMESSSDSESERYNSNGGLDTIQLSQDELKAIQQVKAKKEREEAKMHNKAPHSNEQASIKREELMEDDTSDNEGLDNILPISGDLLDNDLVNTIMNEQDDLTKASEVLDELDDAPVVPNKDELTDILSPHFNLESMVRDTGEFFFCFLVNNTERNSKIYSFFFSFQRFAKHGQQRRRRDLQGSADRRVTRVAGIVHRLPICSSVSRSCVNSDNSTCLSIATSKYAK